jgi:hypothetical protein
MFARAATMGDSACRSGIDDKDSKDSVCASREVPRPFRSRGMREPVSCQAHVVVRIDKAPSSPSLP